MEMLIDFPGGQRVDAHFQNFTVSTDQEGAAPTPFDTFLAALGTCAGIYVLGFCKRRNIPTDGMRLIQWTDTDANGHVTQIHLDIKLRPDFPEQYRSAVIRAAEQCKVKKHMEQPPVFGVTASTLDSKPGQ